MYSILLVIIYIAFISLGLPDSVLGAAWPIMYREMNVPVSYAGLVSTLICACTIVSTLNVNRVLAKLGTGRMTAISVAMTAVGLFGFAASNSFLMLCVWAIPYGLGADNSQALMGVQMGFAYTGLTIMPTVFGWIANGISFGLYAGYLLLFLVLMAFFTENLNRQQDKP